MKEILLNILAYLFIWAAASLNREGQSKTPAFSKWWFVQLILIVLGGVILSSAK